MTSNNGLMVVVQKNPSGSTMTHGLKVYGNGSMRDGIVNLINERDIAYSLGIKHNQRFNEEVVYSLYLQKGIKRGVVGGIIGTLLVTKVIPVGYNYISSIKPKYLSLVDNINDIQQHTVKLKEEESHDRY